MTVVCAVLLSACGPVVFGPLSTPAPVPAEVALERQEARADAEAERLRRCQMGETGVRRDDRRCREGVPK
ncbi:MAG: hypothetical protein ACK4FB_11365 [Brevundimonas sp.]|uniref:hypothetical protein n=1 Tax=Brevundimonas sp. TaxID=1871086 RepID=UPI00391A1068